jgi:hypothetical protein
MTPQHICAHFLVLAVCVVSTSAFADQGRSPNANAGNGSDSASSRRPENTPPGLPKKQALPQTDEDAATVLVEVNARNAIPLSALRTAVEALSDGRILDVELIRVRGRLAYDVIVQETNNLVRHIYVDAGSGVEVILR